MLVMLAMGAGWTGAVGTVGAYAMVSRGRMTPQSLRFQGLNVLGGALLSVSALATHSWPSLMSNLVWTLLGVHALVQARHTLRPTVVARVRTLRPRSARPGAEPAVEDVVGLAA